MKHFILSILVIVSFLSASAQQDTTFGKYTGKYKFPEGSPVTEITIAVDNGTLTATSVMGTSELKRTDKEDVYEIVAYGGIATFKKNAEGKVTGVQIVVGSVNIEGTKSDSINYGSFGWGC